MSRSARRRHVAMIALALVTTVGIGRHARSDELKPTVLPPEIRKAIDDVDTACRESSGKPGPSPNLIRSTDLTDDGVTDYILDLGYYNCEGAASALSAGQSGNGMTIYVGGPNHTARKAYDVLTQGIELDTVDGKPRLSVAVMGGECGQKNAATLAMSDVDVCLRPLHWNAADQSFVLGPLSEKRGFAVQ